MIFPLYLGEHRSCCYTSPSATWSPHCSAMLRMATHLALSPRSESSTTGSRRRGHRHCMGWPGHVTKNPSMNTPTKTGLFWIACWETGKSQQVLLDRNAITIVIQSSPSHGDPPFLISGIHGECLNDFWFQDVFLMMFDVSSMYPPVS